MPLGFSSVVRIAGKSDPPLPNVERMTDISFRMAHSPSEISSAFECQIQLNNDVCSAQTSHCAEVAVISGCRTHILVSLDYSNPHLNFLDGNNSHVNVY